MTTKRPGEHGQLLFALGVKLVSWPFKMECCGAGKTLTNKDMTIRLSDRIMDMRSRWRRCVVTPCPLCQMNLDLLPALGRSKETLPVLFLSEVFELALYGACSRFEPHGLCGERAEEGEEVSR